MSASGKPIEFSQELVAAVCQRMCEGESLSQVCRDAAMPTRSLFLKWVKLDTKEGHSPSPYPGLRDLYAHARKELLLFWADEQVEIADNGSNDWQDREFGQGRIERIIDNEAVQRSRLRVDTRKWLLAKLMPRVYGDKLDLTHANPDGTNLGLLAAVMVKTIDPHEASETYAQLVGSNNTDPAKDDDKQE